MDDAQVIWDLPDDVTVVPVRIIDGHDVTIEEVEEVLRNPYNDRTYSRSSGFPMVFGWTSTGKYITVVYEEVLDDPLIVRPVTAYPVPPP